MGTAIDKTLQGLLSDIAEAGSVVHRIKSSRKGAWRVGTGGGSVRKNDTLQRAALAGFVRIEGDTAKLTAAGLQALRGASPWAPIELEPGSDSAPQAPRFFIDTLTRFGELYLIPASKRMDWHAFDVQQEEAAEVLPVPEYAKPIGELSHVEFSEPKEVM